MSDCAVVVMPRDVGAWPGAEALWVTARGWARAAQDRFGEAWIATPGGAWPVGSLPDTGGGRGRSRPPYPFPQTLKTLVKDVRLWRRQSRFELPADGPWSGRRVRLVWEHHDLFNRAGGGLAGVTGAPWVRYVHAPQVWEARKWGVRRPLWGGVLERGEGRHLRRADLVACVSSRVRDRVVEMGVEPGRTVISPMAVDADVFTPRGEDMRARLAIPPEAVVVGWCGSFRPFHGLRELMAGFAAAAARHPELHLLLIGDGPMRGELERAVEWPDRVHFSGRVDHSRMPHWLRAVDVAVVSSQAGHDFHYSPLKLREYAACGLPVVAPDQGEMAELADCGFLNLHAPGDPGQMAATLGRLAADPADRERQGAAARAHTLRRWTWSAQLSAVLDHLGGAEGDRRSRISG